MKIVLIFLAFASLFGDLRSQRVLCENEGCYEVIKTFAELLEKKINETDAILAEAANELNKINFGNDESFAAKIKEVDEKLAKLIREFYIGVDGGEKPLFDLVNSVFEGIDEIDKRAGEVESELSSAAKTAEAIRKNQEETQDTIKRLQDDLDKFMNLTSYEGPQALQDAFDRSQKFDSSSNQLKAILDEVKLILRDYETNLMNAKRLTSQAIEKFVKVSEQATVTLDEQKKVDNKLKETGDMKMSEDELKNMKKVAREALEQAGNVFEEAFDLLNEVSEFALNDKLDEINVKVEKLKTFSETTEVSLEEFLKENSKFLAEMEKTIDAAEMLKKKDFDLLKKIEEPLLKIKGTREEALQAIANADSTVKNAVNIYKSLHDFNMKVEESSENAQIAKEKIPEIMKKIQDSVNIVEKLESRLESNSKIAGEAKEKCTKAKEQMIEILSESDEMRANIEALKKDLEKLPEAIEVVDKEERKLSDEIDKLEKAEADDSKLIETTNEKIAKTKSQTQKTDDEIEAAIKKLQRLVEDIAKLKNIDEPSLDDFESKLEEVENELDESGLDNNLGILKTKRQNQSALIERYKLEIAAMEDQISVLKKNAESLEQRCFKRTRLEP